MTQVEAQLIGEDDIVDLTSASTYSSGEFIQLTDGRAGFVLGLKAIASGDEYAVQVEGRVFAKAASAVTFAVGEMAWWDASANTAINEKDAGSGDFAIGRAYRAKASGASGVYIELNEGVMAGKINFTGTIVEPVSTITTSAFTLRTSVHGGKTILLTSAAGSRHKRLTLAATSLVTCGTRFSIINGVATLTSNGISIIPSATILLNGSSALVKSSSRAAVGAAIEIVRVGSGYYTRSQQPGKAVANSLVWV